MTQLSPTARKRLTQRTEVLTGEVDATLLSNVIHDRLTNDEQLHELAEAQAALERALTTRAESDQAVDETWSRLDTANGELHTALVARSRERAAELCAMVIRETPDWGNAWDARSIRAAREEALAWLTQHRDVAEQANVDVDAAREAVATTEVSG